MAHLYKIGINFRRILNKYHYIILNYTSGLQHQDIFHYLLVSFTLLKQLVNNAQFLNIISLSFLSASPSALIVPPLITVMVPLICMYASLYLHQLELNIVVAIVIVYFNLIFCPKFGWLICNVLSNKLIIF